MPSNQRSGHNPRDWTLGLGMHLFRQAVREESKPKAHVVYGLSGKAYSQGRRVERLDRKVLAFVKNPRGVRGKQVRREGRAETLKLLSELPFDPLAARRSFRRVGRRQGLRASPAGMVKVKNPTIFKGLLVSYPRDPPRGPEPWFVQKGICMVCKKRAWYGVGDQPSIRELGYIACSHPAHKIKRNRAREEFKSGLPPGSLGPPGVSSPAQRWVLGPRGGDLRRKEKRWLWFAKAVLKHLPNAKKTGSPGGDLGVWLRGAPKRFRRKVYAGGDTGVFTYQMKRGKASRAQRRNAGKSLRDSLRRKGASAGKRAIQSKLTSRRVRSSGLKHGMIRSATARCPGQKTKPAGFRWKAGDLSQPSKRISKSSSSGRRHRHKSTG